MHKATTLTSFVYVIEIIKGAGIDEQDDERE